MFSELLAEGRYAIKMILSDCADFGLYVMIVCRHVARFCESYMRGVASKAMTSIEQLLNSQITKFTDFEVIIIRSLTSAS